LSIAFAVRLLSYISFYHCIVAFCQHVVLKRDDDYDDDDFSPKAIWYLPYILRGLWYWHTSSLFDIVAR